MSDNKIYSNFMQVIAESVDTQNVIKLDWDVHIDHKSYQVVKVINPKAFGFVIGDNECSGLSLWAYPRGHKPTIENLVAYTLDDSGIWGIRTKNSGWVKPYPYRHTYSSCNVIITRNGDDFYNLYGNDMTNLVIEALNIINKIKIHPLQFSNYNWFQRSIDRNVKYMGNNAKIIGFANLGFEKVVLKLIEGEDEGSTFAISIFTDTIDWNETTEDK